MYKHDVMPRFFGKELTGDVVQRETETDFVIQEQSTQNI